MSEICSMIVFFVKVWHSKCTGRSPGSSFGCESLQPAKMKVSLLKDRLDVILEAFLLSTNTPWPSLRWPLSMRWGSLLWGILIMLSNQRGWRWRSMDSIVGIPALDLISERYGTQNVIHQFNVIPRYGITLNWCITFWSTVQSQIES